jgi:hypothetical protein
MKSKKLCRIPSRLLMLYVKLLREPECQIAIANKCSVRQLGEIIFKLSLNHPDFSTIASTTKTTAGPEDWTKRYRALGTVPKGTMIEFCESECPEVLANKEVRVAGSPRPGAKRFQKLLDEFADLKAKYETLNFKIETLTSVIEEHITKPNAANFPATT